MAGIVRFIAKAAPANDGLREKLSFLIDLTAAHHASMAKGGDRTKASIPNGGFVLKEP